MGVTNCQSTRRPFVLPSFPVPRRVLPPHLHGLGLEIPPPPLYLISSRVVACVGATHGLCGYRLREVLAQATLDLPVNLYSSRLPGIKVRGHQERLTSPPSVLKIWKTGPTMPNCTMIHLKKLSAPHQPKTARRTYAEARSSSSIAK